MYDGSSIWVLPSLRMMTKVGMIKKTLIQDPGSNLVKKKEGNYLELI